MEKRKVTIETHELHDDEFEMHAPLIQRRPLKNWQGISWTQATLSLKLLIASLGEDPGDQPR